MKKPQPNRPSLINLGQEMTKSMTDAAKNLAQDKYQKANKTDSILVIVARYCNNADAKCSYINTVFGTVPLDIILKNRKITYRIKTVFIHKTDKVRITQICFF